MIVVCEVELAMEGGEEVSLPPPPPVPEGAVPAKAPGYGGGSAGASGSGSVASQSGAEAGSKKPMHVVPVPAKATRSDYGKLGRPTKLCVNYFRARLVKAEDVYHYNVRFNLWSIFLSSGFAGLGRGFGFKHIVLYVWFVSLR